MEARALAATVARDLRSDSLLPLVSEMKDRMSVTPSRVAHTQNSPLKTGRQRSRSALCADNSILTGLADKNNATVELTRVKLEEEKLI